MTEISAFEHYMAFLMGLGTVIFGAAFIAAGIRMMIFAVTGK